jgi:hypothetical protein
VTQPRRRASCETPPCREAARSKRSQVRREIVLAAATVGIFVLLRERLPHVVPVGDLLLLGAVALLLQGLARDLGRLVDARRASEPRRVTCVCLESTVGLAAIVAGAALALGWTAVRVNLSPLTWPAGLAAVLAFGVLTRDVVFDWRLLRLRREADHQASVRWRS